MNTINEVWDRDPHDHTDETIDAVIAEMREKRQQFLAGNQRAGKVTVARAPEGADPEKAKEALAGLGL